MQLGLRGHGPGVGQEAVEGLSKSCELGCGICILSA